MRYRLGCDIGGTFTDFSVLDTTTGEVVTHKRLTTPDVPSVAIEEGVRLLAGQIPHLLADSVVIHGTTLVINAVIERKGARTALVTTQGFRVVLEIGREGRFDQYDIWLRFPKPIVPRQLRYEVPERVHVSGRVLDSLSGNAVSRVIDLLREDQIEAVAICLLHSYSNDAHERALGEAINAQLPGVPVSLSSAVAPEVGEYERSCTTAVNAYTQPLTERYLSDLERRLRDLGFRNDLLVTLSTGGVTSIETARTFPVRIMESGPAAGAIGAAYFARQLGLDMVVSFDMGGTTAKTALIKNGRMATTDTFEVDRTYRFKRGSGIPVRAPMVDLIEIGAGGGSIARITDARTIQVGPDSVGASPGPACYDAGGEMPTVTDANLVLGYLNADYFLGGAMTLRADLAERAIRERIAEPLGVGVLQAAYGIHSIVNENMASAAQVYLAEQGEDISDSALFAFGGCGPVHAVDLMHRIGVRHVIIPPRPGVASAFGMSVAPVSYDVRSACRVPLDALDFDALERLFVRLQADGVSRLPQFVPVDSVLLRRSLFMRYVGQGYEVSVDLPNHDQVGTQDVQALFDQAYQRLYGRTEQDQRVEAVSAALNLSYPQASYPERLPGSQAGESVVQTRQAYLPEARAMVDFKVFRRDELAPGTTFQGPAIIEESDSSIVIASEDTVTVHETGCVMIVQAKRDPRNSTPIRQKLRRDLATPI